MLWNISNFQNNLIYGDNYAVGDLWFSEEVKIDYNADPTYNV